MVTFSVSVPTIRAERSRERNVPEMVIPGLSGMRVLPAAKILPGLTLNASLPTVKYETAEMVASVNSLCGARVELPMMMLPPGAREMSVPEMVIPGPPGVRV